MTKDTFLSFPPRNGDQVLPLVPPAGVEGLFYSLSYPTREGGPARLSGFNFVFNSKCFVLYRSMILEHVQKS